jgi:hypothetical protein
VDYVFEYFNNYLNTTEAEEKTVLHSEKLDKYLSSFKIMSLKLENGWWVFTMNMENRSTGISVIY